jgi:hypothetical protein
LTYYLSIFVEGLRKAIKNISLSVKGKVIPVQAVEALIVARG